MLEVTGGGGIPADGAEDPRFVIQREAAAPTARIKGRREPGTWSGNSESTGVVMGSGNAPGEGVVS